MTPYMILLLPFLILGEKEVPRRGMSGKRGDVGTVPQKSSVGEEGVLFDSPRHFVTPPSEMMGASLPGRLRGKKAHS